jgi:hypothetical protein
MDGAGVPAGFVDGAADGAWKGGNVQLELEVPGVQAATAAATTPPPATTAPRRNLRRSKPADGKVGMGELRPEVSAGREGMWCSVMAGMVASPQPRTQ